MDGLSDGRMVVVGKKTCLSMVTETVDLVFIDDSVRAGVRHVLIRVNEVSDYDRVIAIR